MSGFFPFTSHNQLVKKAATQQNNQTSHHKYFYEEVIRKNQDIIKTILTKINEIYSRQEDYQTSLAQTQQKIQSIAEDNKNIHHQVRINHLQIEKKQHILINDIGKIKNGLKMPEDGVPHEEYLSSHFFQEQSHSLNQRARSKRKIQSKKKFFSKHAPSLNVDLQDFIEQQSHQDQKINNRQASAFDFSDALNSIKNTNEKQKMLQVNDKGLPSQKYSDKKSVKFSDEVTNVVQKIQQDFISDLNSLKNDVSNKTAKTDFDLLKHEIDLKLQKISSDFVRSDKWNHIDFQELQSYLDKRVEEKFIETVTKKYFSESINNLKKAWEKQLDEIYTTLDQKLTKVDLLNIDDKFAEIQSQFQSIMNLNSVKIQNISYNSSAKTSPLRINFDKNNEELSNCTSTIRDSQSFKTRNSHLKYSSSVSALSREEWKEEKESGISEKRWKKKAAMFLGLAQNKIKRERA